MTRDLRRVQAPAPEIGIKERKGIRNYVFFSMFSKDGGGFTEQTSAQDLGFPFRKQGRDKRAGHVSTNILFHVSLCP